MQLLVGRSVLHIIPNHCILVIDCSLIKATLIPSTDHSYRKLALWGPSLMLINARRVRIIHLCLIIQLNVRMFLAIFKKEMY